MTKEREVWLGTQRKLVCAAIGRRGALFDYVSVTVHEILVAHGHALPLSVTVDLTALWLGGPDIVLQVPDALPWGLKPDALTPYCKMLKDRRSEAPLRRLLAAVRRLRDLPMSEGSRPGEKRQLPGLLTFLERAACRLPASETPSRYGPPERSDNPVTAARLAITGFLRALVPEDDLRLTSLDVFLALAAARRPAGAEALDLAVLQTCVDEDAAEQRDDRRRDRRQLEHNLSPRENRSSRSPELGNHGIDTKGTTSSVLRSFLAREHFEELLMMKQVLYFQRFAPGLEPHRVLLGWVIERSTAMRSRVVGRRRETIALRLAVQTIQDALRYFSPVAALDLRVAVLMHNAEEGKAQAGCYLEPSADFLERATGSDAGDSGLSLAESHAFLPDFFLREPDWGTSGSKRGPDRPFAGRSRHRRPLPRALEVLGRYAAKPDVSGYLGGFDLFHVAVLESAEKLWHNESQRNEMLHVLSPHSSTVSINFFTFGAESIEWNAWRPLAHGEESQNAGYADASESLRETYWQDMGARLRRLV